MSTAVYDRAKWLTWSRILAVALLVTLMPSRLLCDEPAGDSSTVARQLRRAWVFEEAGVTFDNCFSGARVNGCEVKDSGEFELWIEPENEPINNSAWYAFRVSADRSQTIQVRLRVRGGTHRYRPKISHDGRHWVRLSSPAYRSERRSARLELEVGPEPLWVAGQELIGCKALDGWTATLGRLPFARRTLLGRSLEDRPIHLLEIGTTLGSDGQDSDGQDNGSSERPQGYVVIVGRQHPPEVTGSLALMQFVEELAGDTQQARDFRQQFRLLVVPLLNPDGVHEGHWRHNLRGVDLNRDWGPFEQPETQLARDRLFERFQKEDGPQLYLFLDFHSTRSNLFYTQRDDAAKVLPQFTSRWLQALGERFEDYQFERISGHLAKSPTSMNWVHEQFQVPAITYEFDDRVDRTQLRRIARGAAQEMMRLLVQKASPDESGEHRPEEAK